MRITPTSCTISFRIITVVAVCTICFRLLEKWLGSVAGPDVELIVERYHVCMAETAFDDQQVYESFRKWETAQPASRSPTTGGQSELLAAYRGVLAREGVAAAEIERRLALVETAGTRLEVERWNQILTNAKPTFNAQPNSFLVEVVKRRTPGTALDVGMGQGRNAIYLAQQEWTVTGFDPAQRAVAAAEASAQRLAVRMTTSVDGEEQFEWGRDRWDLIVLSYVGARNVVARVLESLRQGGIVVVEAFHRDATKNASIGAGVVFDTNELLQLFAALRIVRYEDTEAVADFGTREATRVVRLAAEKH
jgi:SAM-dependent methyltransferase